MKHSRMLFVSISLLFFFSHTNAQLKVQANGFVGIGNSSPSQRLVVNGNEFIEGQNKLYIYNTNRYLGIPGGTGTGDLLLTCKDAGTKLRIASVGSIGFWGASSGESTSVGHNVCINGFGVGIGTNATAWSGVNLYISGSGWVTGVWSVGSDKRFKNNIVPVDGALSKILKLNGKSYTYNREEFVEYNLPMGKSMGFIAQELNEIFPELVSKDENGYYGINYIGVIPVLVEAIKEQNKKLTDLETQLSYCCTNKQEGNLTVPNEGGLGQSNTKPSLLQNNPNPFSKETSIGYYLPTETRIASIMIFDMQGKLVKTLAVTNFGSASLTINANELSPGMFIYSLVADGKEVDSKRLILTQ